MALRGELWMRTVSEARTEAVPERERRHMPPEASPMKKRETGGEEIEPAATQEARGRRTVSAREMAPEEGDITKAVSLLLPGRPQRTAGVLSGRNDSQKSSVILQERKQTMKKKRKRKKKQMKGLTKKKR